MIVVWVYYTNTKRHLQINFKRDPDAAIDIARLYSEDENVLQTRVILNECIELAKFAGFYEGRSYDTRNKTKAKVSKIQASFKQWKQRTQSLGQLNG